MGRHQPKGILFKPTKTEHSSGKKVLLPIGPAARRVLARLREIKKLRSVSAVDHFDACCVGIHTVKTGNRFAALQPIAQGLHTGFGATGADAGRALALRMDHGTQYTADDFLNQVKFWGIAPSFALLAEPQTNGVAERFNRTLKEQTIHGRVFQNLEAVRTAATAFADRYNRHWRLEKLGFMSPREARQAYAMRNAA